MSYALIFPGQGAQEVGMAHDLYEKYPVIRETFERADSALGFGLSDLIFNGPEEELRKTEFTQPAILTASIAALKALEQEIEKPLNPAFMAGHSLGEYTSLVASNVLSLEDGVRLVRLRGHLMQEAVPLGQGAMAAILGLTAEKVQEICRKSAKQGICQAANFNSPGQIVISGETSAVDHALKLSREAGAKRAIPLKVSAPFHCSLMRGVADQLREAFMDCSWQDPSVPVVANVSAHPVNRVGDIQNALYDQTYSPVLWADSVQYMNGQNVDLFIELGPGKVLSGLVRKCVRKARVANLGKIDEIEKTLTILKGGNQRGDNA